LFLSMLLIIYFWFYAFIPRKLPGFLKFGIPMKQTNILIMGLDQTYDERHNPTRFHRTDSLILANLNPFSQKINMISIPRDTVTDIPGHGKNKINSAYAFGQAPLAVLTVSNLLGLRIDRSIILRSDGIARLVDGIGGLKIFVEKDLKYKDSWGGLDINLKKGCQQLSGKQVHDYIRFRHDASGDLGRITRQQTFLKELFKKLGSSATIFRLPWLISCAKGSISSDMPFRQLFAVGNFLRMADKQDISANVLPSHVSSEYKGSLEPDQKETEKLLLELGIRR
ncbi:MAG: LCP family protein, partial [Candidatus Margulisiibacteriota bacterium]